MKAIWTLLLTISLFSCGGGGGGSEEPTGIPFAKISLSRALAVIGQDILFDASGSSDDGQIVNYWWDFGDGTNASGIQVSKSYSYEGNFTVHLVLTDDDGQQATASAEVQVTNEPASALTILSSQSAGAPPLIVSFQAFSSANDLANQQVSWDFGDGSFATTIGEGRVVHTYYDEGRFTVRASRLFEGQQQVAESSVVVLDGNSYSLSGTISAPFNTVVDSDVNNPDDEYLSNNSYQTAQALPPIAIVSGYLAGQASWVASDRFASSADPIDIYSVNLQAGQLVFLEIAEWESSSADFDLYLVDQATQGEVASSLGINKTELLRVEQTGSYYLRVETYPSDGFTGLSGNYTLRLIGQNSVAIAPSLHWSTQQEFVPGQVVMQHKQGRFAANAIAQLGLSHLSSTPQMGLYQFDDSSMVVARSTQLKDSLGTRFTPEYLAKRDTLLKIKQLNSPLGTEQASPNFIYRPSALSNDPLVARQWHYPQIYLAEAWQAMQGEALNDVVVAVIDTGMFQNHPDLQNQLTSDGFDFVSDVSMSLDGDGFDADPEDPGDLGLPDGGSSWHGTHVAGTIAAQTNNGVGVAGIAPQAKIMNLRALGYQGGTSWDISQAVLYAAGLQNATGRLPNRRADIINMSLGSDANDTGFEAVVRQAISRGLIVVAAAGNEGYSYNSYPAAYEQVIGVSAVDAANELTGYSNYGFYVDLAAPGGDSSLDLNGDGYGDGVYSTYVVESPSNQPSYQYLNGTSMAAPHVAGVVALMRQLNSELDSSEFLNLLAQGLLTDDLGSEGYDIYYGHGLINAYKAVLSQLDGPQPNNGGLSLSTNQISMSYLDSRATVQVLQSAGSTTAVDSINNAASWLNIQAVQVDFAGVGEYALSVNRSNLADGNYTTTVSFVLSNGASLNLVVSMNVSQQQAADSGLLYVLLSDPVTGSTLYQQEVSMSDGQFSFSFPSVVAGEYDLIAGSDHDNDNRVCNEGELCGAYPVLNNPSSILLTDDTQGLNFNVEPIITEDLSDLTIINKLLY